MAEDFDPDDFKLDIIGPTWTCGDDGKFVLPEFSLGWEALRWTYEYLKSPTGGPWTYSPEQARLLLWWYALDERGMFTYIDGTIQRVKGWGKDPFAATLAAFELCGPCRFDHWGENGQPVGKQPFEPWVQIGGPSREACKNSMKLFPSLFNAKAKKEYDLKIGKELIYAQDATGRIESMSSSAETAEGGRPKLVILGETHRIYDTNGGSELVQTAKANAGKVDGRSLAITNAFLPGMNSVGEKDWLRYKDILAGRAVDPGIMYDSLAAPSTAPLTLEAIPKVLERVRGDSVWLNIENTMRRILDPGTPEGRSRRFYYNQIVSSADALLDAEDWDGCGEAYIGKTLKPGDEVVLGLDGGGSDDSTALVAIRVSDRFVQALGVWEKPHIGVESTDIEWQVDMLAVDECVATAFATYNVRAFFSDVNPIQSYVDSWSETYRDQLLIRAKPGRSTVGYDMRGSANGPEITTMNESLVGAIRSKRIKQGGRGVQYGTVLREHVLNTFKAENRWGVSFRKESRESNRKVDAYAALLLAYIALTKLLESGKTAATKSQKRGWLM